VPGGSAPKPPRFSEPSGYIEGGQKRWRLIHGSIAKAEQTFAAATGTVATGRLQRCKNCVRGKQNSHGPRAQRFSTYHAVIAAGCSSALPASFSPRDSEDTPIGNLTQAPCGRGMTLGRGVNEPSVCGRNHPSCTHPSRTTDPRQEAATVYKRPEHALVIRHVASCRELMQHANRPAA